MGPKSYKMFNNIYIYIYIYIYIFRKPVKYLYYKLHNKTFNIDIVIWFLKKCMLVNSL